MITSSPSLASSHACPFLPTAQYTGLLLPALVEEEVLSLNSVRGRERRKEGGRGVWPFILGDNVVVVASGLASFVLSGCGLL